MAIVSVRLEKIKYGGWEELEVAIDVKSPKDLYLTYPTAETILNYRADSVREKIASKSLKAFLGAGRTVGKFTGNIVNKEKLVGATAKVALILLEDFIAIATWEAVENQNKAVGRVLAAGLGDSIRSIAYEQLGIKLDLDDRHQYLAKRQTHKEQFHPQYTVWLKKDAGGDSSAVNWGSKVNELKLAAGIPLTFIDEYNPAEYATIDRLNRAYSSYHSLRLAGISHEGAIGVLKLQNN